LGTSGIRTSTDSMPGWAHGTKAAGALASAGAGGVVEDTGVCGGVGGGAHSGGARIARWCRRGFGLDFKPDLPNPRHLHPTGLSQRSAALQRARSHRLPTPSARPTFAPVATPQRGFTSARAHSLLRSNPFNRTVKQASHQLTTFLNVQSRTQRTLHPFRRSMWDRRTKSAVERRSRHHALFEPLGEELHQ
jgi:hypothetical protein